jgi:V/A-type H+-transporting ATPase subunit I
MQQLRLVVLACDEEAVLSRLGQLGLVQLTRTSPKEAPESLTPCAHDQALVRCASLVERLERLSTSLEVTELVTSATIFEGTLEQCEAQLSLFEANALELTQGLQQLTEQRQTLREHLQLQSPYQEVLQQLGAAALSPHLQLLAGSVPNHRWVALQQAVGADVLLLPLAEWQGRQLMLLLAPTTRMDLVALLQRSGFEAQHLAVEPSADLSVRLFVERQRLRRLDSELAELQEERAELVAELRPQLVGLRGWLTVRQQLLRAGESLCRTQRTVLLSGWLPTRDVPQLHRQLLFTTQGRLSLEVEPPQGPEEEIPVLLSSSDWLRPFAPLVRGYGLPRYNELDPTAFVAVTYLLMFGMMFGDIGHGALVALAGLGALRWVRLASLRQWAPLLLGAGISSMAFGLLYGSCFGLAGARAVALWQDPLEANPVILMLAAVAFGVGVISLGLLLNIANRWRNGDRWGALTHRFGITGLSFYWGALLLAVFSDRALLQGVMGWLLLTAVLLPPIVWLLQEPLRPAPRRWSGPLRRCWSTSLTPSASCGLRPTP